MEKLMEVLGNEKLLYLADDSSDYYNMLTVKVHHVPIFFHISQLNCDVS